MQYPHPVGSESGRDPYRGDGMDEAYAGMPVLLTVGIPESGMELNSVEFAPSYSSVGDIARLPRSQPIHETSSDQEDAGDR